MSAWIATDRHIASVAKYINPDDAQRIADLLLAENIKSVNARYNEDTAIETCDLDEAIELTAVDAYSLIVSLEYQSCEHADWEGSEAYRILNEATQQLEAGPYILKDKDGSTLGKWSI